MLYLLKKDLSPVVWGPNWLEMNLKKITTLHQKNNRLSIKLTKRNLSHSKCTLTWPNSRIVYWCHGPSGDLFWCQVQIFPAPWQNNLVFLETIHYFTHLFQIACLTSRMNFVLKSSCQHTNSHLRPHTKPERAVCWHKYILRSSTLECYYVENCLP